MQTPTRPIPFDQMDAFLTSFADPEQRGSVEITPIVSFPSLGIVVNGERVDPAEGEIAEGTKLKKMSAIYQDADKAADKKAKAQTPKVEDDHAMALRAPSYVSPQGASHAPAKAHHTAKSKETTAAAHKATSHTIGSSNALKHHEAKTAHEVAAHHAKMAGHQDLASHHSQMAMHHGDIYRAMGALHDRHASFHQHNPHMKGENAETRMVNREDLAKAQWENQQRYGQERFHGLCVSGRARATEQEDVDAFTDCSVLEGSAIDYSHVSLQVWAELEEMAKLGSGARFKALQKKIARKGGVRDPAAVAAAIGRKKFGKKKFQKLAAAGESVEDLTLEDVSAAAHRASTHTTMVRTSDAHVRAQKLHLKAAVVAHQSGNKKLAAQHRELAASHGSSATSMKSKGL